MVLDRPTFTAEDRELDWSPPERIWSGPPLIAPRGADLFGDLLFVTDPGDRRDPDGKPARIVKFRIDQGRPTNPSIFFQRKGFLLSAKWSKPTRLNGRDFLLVADQGRELPDGTFTGEGAKLFLLPILSNGTAGEPKVIWSGPPFACPTAVAHIGTYVYVTDPCAGDLMARPEAPHHVFRGSRLFAVHIDGRTPPRVMLENQPFTSMIGLCPAIPGQLIITDTDSGRLDPTETGGRLQFAPPAGADRWLVDILDVDTPRLSAPVRENITERGGIVLTLANVPADARIEIFGENHQLLNPLAHSCAPGQLLAFSAAQLLTIQTPPSGGASPALLSGRVRLTAVVPATLTTLRTRVRVARMSGPGTTWLFSIPRDPGRPPIFSDNKHGGATREARLFTTDSAPGRAAIWIYPYGGGTPVSIWKGAPLVRPVSAHLSGDESLLYIADQSGQLFIQRFVPAAAYDALFPRTTK